MINSAEAALSGNSNIKANLRFAHAETIIPLFGLMALPGCYYLTHYFDSVGKQWQDGYVAPMASNLQLIYFSSPSGKIYVRGDLNEIPITLIRGNDSLYVSWDDLKNFWYQLLL